MKKIVSVISLLLLLSLLLCFVSCDENAPISTSTVEETAEKTAEETLSQTGISEEHNIREILLPENGETITYNPSLVLYSNDNGDKLEIVSANRKDNKITFHTTATEDKFSNYIFGMTMLTSEDEIFAGLIKYKTLNGTYDYYISIAKDANADNLKETLPRDIKNAFGDDFDENKNYCEFYVIPF